MIPRKTVVFPFDDLQERIQKEIQWTDWGGGEAFLSVDCHGIEQGFCGKILLE